MTESFFYRLSVLALLVPAALAFGCGAAGVGEAEPPESFVEATVNGSFWRAPASGDLHADRKVLVLGADSLNIADYYRQSISFVIPFSGEGRYSLKRSRLPDGMPEQVWIYGAIFNEVDYDATIAGYAGVEAEGTGLHVTRYDADAGIVEGTFSAVLVLDGEVSERAQRLRRYPDTVRVTDGRFRLVLGTLPQQRL
jgi:hypothetical protein